MLWFYIVVTTGIGLLLGLCFRSGAVIAASAVLAIASATIGPLFAGWSAWVVLGAVFGGLFALQSGYLAGVVLLTYAVSRIGRLSKVHNNVRRQVLLDR